MDPPLPPDFDPTTLVYEPMDQPQQPSERHEAHDQNGGPTDDCPGHVEDFMHFVPASLKRFIVAGSCCSGVLALYVLSSWDHGWIPGVESPFAQTSDLRKSNEEIAKSNQEIATMKSEVKELYLLGIASSIRDLQAEMCTAPSQAKANELERLQQRYLEKTGARYPERSHC